MGITLNCWNFPEHEYNFPEGQSTISWYKGFLRRHCMLTGTERPLEITRAEWCTPENLEQYFKNAANVFVKAGVATRYPDFNPDQEGSEMVLITHPERIASFDETKVNLDSTDTSKAKTDRLVRAGGNDHGECIVTKSSASITAVCGRLGNGLALPPYIVFNSSQSFDVSSLQERQQVVLSFCLFCHLP